MVGSILPFILRRLRFDPATSSAPFVATLVDVTGLIIYFTVGLVVLWGTLLSRSASLANHPGQHDEEQKRHPPDEQPQLRRTVAARFELPQTPPRSPIGLGRSLSIVFAALGIGSHLLR